MEPLEDITVRSRRDGLPPRREDTNPLDLAVLRLAALEQNVERRYLKEPLWAPHEVVLEKAVLSGPEELSPTEMRAPPPTFTPPWDPSPPSALC